MKYAIEILNNQVIFLTDKLSMVDQKLKTSDRLRETWTSLVSEKSRLEKMIESLNNGINKLKSK